jgi:hypothetical protein
MSLILLGPKRVYVVLLFWERVADPDCALRRSLSRIDRALGAEGPGYDEDGGTSACRLVLAVRWHRVLRERLIGLSLLVFDSQR